MAGDVDGRSDIFSYGLVLYECLTGQSPFPRTTPAEVMTAILREDAPDLPETVSPALRQIVAHCLEKERDRRFHSARDLAFALRTVQPTSAGSRPTGQLAAIAASRSRMWLWPALAIGMALLLAAVAVPHFLERAPIDLAAYRFTPFANDHEPEDDAVWSPDGKSIAYLKTIGGTPQLMVRALDTAVPIQLTKSAARVGQPFWAPDSTLIYYTAHEGKGELWGVSPVGGRAARILQNLRTAAIAPDGKTLALWRAEETAGGDIKASLWISSPPGAAPRPYQPAPFAVPLDSAGNSLGFAPDGASILLVTAGVSPAIWVLPLPENRGTPRRLFADMEFNWVPRASWFPDSRHAVLSFSTGGTLPSLWLADLKREKLRRLTASAGAEECPSLSPDGRRMVFTGTTDDYDLIELPLDGSKPRTLLANSRNMYSPSWSPQGDQFLYATDREGASEIWLHNLKASLDRPLVTARDFPAGTTSLVHPVFSPDGSRFAFVRSSTDEPTTIWVEPIVGGAPIRLTAEYIVAPTWSPDGNSIAGLMHRERPWQPAIVGVGANMTPHVIAGAPTCLMPLEWSPAGDWLACEARDGIQLFSPDGQHRRTLPKLNTSAISFSRDGKTLYAAGRDDGRTFLKSIDLTAANPAAAVHDIATHTGEMTISGGATYRARLSLSPDGKSLATSAVDRKSDLWLLEGYPFPGR